MAGFWVLVSVSVATIFSGLFLRKATLEGSRKVILRFVLMGLFASIVLGGTLAVFPEASLAAAGGLSSGAGMGFVGAAVAAGLACIGAGIAVAVVGAAAMGVIGEKPEMLGTTLIYLGLAEGIAIYGVIVALLILGKI
ncbi:ATP synthase subunit C [Thermovirga lienii]|jgi:V/A-type H+-transporting ATPase subunit K|uniref:ATP synthase subunit C n=1 Tax=Thermovirga lienii TaxID=336261 RepID=UPI000749A707|nr:MAG: H+transporting two-sector ATPase C subunit [Thermovirga lienii]MDN5318340.1 V/A-type H+/Na+-transporting ATPase subunit [Thermovirga sp.]MDN5367863.1 V/A-type H+/Na+-transporting ATPase subunit [Thermovirga sp.]HCD71413.1 ATPase [Thermovirga lienii]